MKRRRIGTTIPFANWLKSLPAGVVIHTEVAGRRIRCTIDHAIVPRKRFMRRVMRQNLWIMSYGSNKSLKEYVFIGKRVTDNERPIRPNWQTHPPLNAELEGIHRPRKP